MISQRSKYALFIAAGSLIILGACKKWLPEDLDYLSKQASYTQTTFNPIMGRTTLYSQIFNTDASTTPINFKITNVRYKGTKKPTNDLDKKVNVKVWKEAYTGYEKSLQEIESKRATEEHSIWEVREHSGDFVLWAEADSTMMRQLPDSGYLFDVEASNSGGTNVYKDLEVTPYRIQPYYPYDDHDPITGGRMTVYPLPSDSSVFFYRDVHVAAASGIEGDSTELEIVADSIRVLFNRVGDGNSLTFKFLDKDSALMNPALFNQTNWDSLVHGFNVKVTDTYVRYDVAYPIPVTNFPTRYTTNDGSHAAIHLYYDRKGFGGFVIRARIDFNFAIYQKGDWEILFYFHSDTPRFKDE